MGELVHYNKIFPFTEEDKETIKKACELKDAFDENVFSYSEIPDKEDDYFGAIYDSVRYYVAKFNTVKGTKDTYYVYLVNLKNTKFELYKDQMFSSTDACYILNYIKPDIVEKIGKI